MHFARLILAAAMAALIPALTPGGAAADAGAGLLSHWVQMGPGGAAELRIATTAAQCPDIAVNGHRTAMVVRAKAGDGFPLICSAPLPGNARSAWLVDPAAPPGAAGPAIRIAPVLLPVAAPKRILVLGDTGCRIKGGSVQACNDPAQWPFPLLARVAAAEKPDLIVHVGDYLYRESSCPPHDARCSGSPSGDNWASWDADFFAPAKPLLEAAPFVFVRGNHEDCPRAGAGWLRLMGPGPFVPGQCSHLAPYAVPLGAMNLVVMDSASAPDMVIDHNLLATYRADFRKIAELAPAPIWLASHRPLWGAVSRMGFRVGGNRTMIAALDPADLAPVSLMLSGHIHAFEVLNYRRHLPPQLIAGNGGDKLDTAPADLAGANLSGQAVKDGFSLPGFGFAMLTQGDHGWRLAVHREDGSLARTCHLTKGHGGRTRIDCPQTAQR
jgi:hypothetical protein